MLFLYVHCPYRCVISKFSTCILSNTTRQILTSATCFGSYCSHLQALRKRSNEHWLLHLCVGDTYCLRLLLKSWWKVVVKIPVITNLWITWNHKILCSLDSGDCLLVLCSTLRWWHRGIFIQRLVLRDVVVAGVGCVLCIMLWCIMLWLTVRN
jgi:hypothetical protein